MATITVSVWDKPYEVEVYQRSKSVWIATGTYMGETRQCKGTSANSAASAWREWARYKGG